MEHIVEALLAPCGLRPPSLRGAEEVADPDGSRPKSLPWPADAYVYLEHVVETLFAQRGERPLLGFPQCVFLGWAACLRDGLRTGRALWAGGIRRRAGRSRSRYSQTSQATEGARRRQLPQSRQADPDCTKAGSGESASEMA